MKFVAHPEQAPSSTEWLYAHPDGVSDVPGQTWRQQLVSYNANPRDNPLGLLEAYRLYQKSKYHLFRIDERFHSICGLGLSSR